MKYCTHCGSQMYDQAAFCSYCGCPAGQAASAVREKPRDESMITVIKVFLIIGCVANGCLLIPLAWCIPMTVSIFRKLEKGEPIGMGMKICTLLFVSLVSGICLLCMND